MSQYIARVALPIRRPVSEVFNAFVEPTTLTRFWLQSASGPLSEGATVEWHFMVPGATDTVTVLEFQLNHRLVLRWSDGSSVSMEFTEYSAGETLVSIATSSLEQDEIETIVGTTEGFSLVLCDLKTLLESGRSANLGSEVQWNGKPG